ncbi:hypothetical protein ACPDHL_03875 [Myroides sp. C15-4]|uniref:hypothetical protein n=1 Tax=Myroides sp. C15-4 TaxID=3400532 RepID=UPI003D2F65D7
METRDTILRLIEQTALILRAFFNQLPLEDPLHEQTRADFSAQLNAQTDVDLEDLLLLKSSIELQNYFTQHPSFDSTNQELLADLVVDLAEKTRAVDTIKSEAYKSLSLSLYQLINETTQTYNWEREAKIMRLKE